ncbi:baseplate J/gp47 family protein [Myxococcus sp. K15C18031901]|uniref:baseplate J/gp47 family protein n=1 Tax=Myxococcus dinghuensis TaxID=2906761 RepID=UPI0020A7519F|nr:baseplate J/gp47 family protein [Myxococcus dinghuensis]MCP3100282.1 baseplate J/gp47 family protein [Myxococcus dinghuensis]
MAPRDTKVAINDAPSQYDRWLRALEEGYAPVDGRTRSELLDFAPRFGALVYFYDLKDTRDGDWVEFFLADPVMVLASIDAMSADGVEERFLRAARDMDAARSADAAFRALSDGVDVVVGLARRFDLWLRGAGLGGQGEAGRLLGNLLAEAIEGPLSIALRAVGSLALGAGSPQALGRPVPLDLAGMLPLWGVQQLVPEASAYRGTTKEARARAAFGQLDARMEVFLDMLSRAQGLARAELPTVLATGDHPPHLALYMAFVQLFRTAQDTVNTVSGRYADFYHRQVLRLSPGGALPDSTYLTFELAEDEAFTASSVPRDTLFPAGKRPDGEDILFGADNAVGVTRASVQQRLALRVLQGPLFDPTGAQPVDDVPVVTREVLASEMPLEPIETDAAGEQPPDARRPGWATFGARDVGETSTTRTVPARLGFAVASRYLLLTGGTRAVTLSVQLSPESSQRLEPLLQALATATGEDPRTLFLEVLRAAFTLEVSISEGFFPVESYDAFIPAVATVTEPQVTGFGLRFELPTTVPAIVPSATGPAPELPTLRALLKSEPVELGNGVSVHPLSLLDAVDFAALELETRVEDLTGLRLDNTDGDIDPSTPWLLFGGTPVVGSYLRIHHAELFIKKPDTLRLTLDWFNLPQDATGFSGYYADYVIGPDGEPAANLFDNQSFKAQLRVLQPGSWTLQPIVPTSTSEASTEEDGVESYLFRTKNDCADPEPEKSGALCPGTELEDFTLQSHTPPAYYDPEKSALELRLTTPPYAFGESLYTLNVLNAVLADLPDTAGCEAKCAEACAGKEGEEWAKCMQECLAKCLKPATPLKYPNPPWTPRLFELSVHYTASCTREELRYFHLLPFDGYHAAARDASRPASLLPRFKAPANLFLGFSGLDLAQSLTLLFQMSGTYEGPGAPPPVRYDLLTKTGWNALPASQVLSDSTRGLQGTGILELDLPAFSSSGTTLLPDTYQWVRASVEQDADAFPRTLDITPHALVATRRSPGADVDTPVPAGTITVSVQELPDVGTITQPLPSFGGRPPETPRTFQVRAGERLRHKARAILPWDYERLVLERYPSIWKVAALPAQALRRSSVPGAVLVVVVPDRAGTASVDPTVPQVGSEVLEDIQAYLQARASPFAQVQVVNPVYVRVTVAARVRFRDGEEVGESIERLDRDLVEYLSPWYYDAARATRRGQYATEADLSEFIQTRPYVSLLYSLELRHAPEPAELDSDWYFLTSATHHDITDASTPAPALAAEGY